MAVNEKKKFVKKTYRKVYVADQDPDGPEPEDEDLEEELEGEAEEMQEALIQDHDPDDTEELRAIDEEEGSDGDQEEVQEELREAYTAGWKAKARMNDKKKSRGWSAGSSQSTLPPSVAQKKQASHCASCGQKGHWRGDPQCPNVLSGKDKPHVKKTGSTGPPPSNTVHFTYAVTTMKKTKTTEEKRTSGPMMSSCPKCRWPSLQTNKFCAQCGIVLNGTKGWQKERGAGRWSGMMMKTTMIRWQVLRAANMMNQGCIIFARTYFVKPLVQKEGKKRGERRSRRHLKKCWHHCH